MEDVRTRLVVAFPQDLMIEPCPAMIVLNSKYDAYFLRLEKMYLAKEIKPLTNAINKITQDARALGGNQEHWVARAKPFVRKRAKFTEHQTFLEREMQRAGQERL